MENTRLYPIEKHGIYIVLPADLPLKECNKRADAFSKRLDTRDSSIPKHAGGKGKKESEIIIETEDTDET